MAQDETTGKLAYKKVLKKHIIFEKEKIYHLYIGAEVIKVTGKHPFRIYDKWVEVQFLHVGDSVSLATGKRMAIDSIVIINGAYTVYNFTVEDFHTYYVSKTGVLVHNCGDFNTLLSKTSSVENRSKSDVQLGSFYKNFNASVKDGVILDDMGSPLTTTGKHMDVRLVDFVITEGGELRIGKGHDFLSNNAVSVKGAGQIRVANGKITEINNNTGHFWVTEAELNNQVKLLDALGVTTKDRKVSVKVPDSKNPRL